MIPLALFSESTPLGERQDLATRLLAVKSDTVGDALDVSGHRFGADVGKPHFPWTALHSQHHLLIWLHATLHLYLGLCVWTVIS